MPSETRNRHTRNDQAQRTKLFGRQADVQAITDLLTNERARTVTLTGPGGVGKTRLALEIATQLADVFTDGISFVELADISELDQVAREIAHVLQLPVRPMEPIQDQLEQFLFDKELLLILDNAEQVIESADLVAHLASVCPRLAILTTGRSRLKLTLEHEYLVAPLEVSGSTEPATLETASAVDAVRLFVDRAKAVRRSFSLTGENASAIVGICRALDGLPLAIELAAARTRVLSPMALLERLDQRLSLLTGGARDRPLRQQTMRNAIDWSYDLLSPSEQQLFRRIALPVGSFSLETAIALDPDNATILDGLESLIDKSLILPTTQFGDQSRFHMLETIRAYGLEQLDANQELLGTTALLSAFAVNLLRRARTGWREHGERSWLEAVRLEFGSIRLVLKSAVDQGNKEIAAQVLSALDWYWEETSQYREGRRWIDQTLILDQELTPQSQTTLLISASALYFRLQEGDQALVFAVTALEHARRLENDQMIAEAISIRAAVEAENGDLDSAESLYIELAELSTAIGRTRGVASAVHNLGMLAFARGDFAVAQARHEEAVARDRQEGDLMRLQNSLVTLAMVKYRQGNLKAMRELMVEQLEIDPRRGLPSLIGATALLSVVEGGFDTTASLMGAAEAGTERIGISRFGSFIYTETFDQAIATTRSELGDVRWTDRWNAGRELSVDAVLELVRGALSPTIEASTSPVASPWDALSTREREVLKLIARGNSNQQIADALFISPATAKVHVRSIMTKLNLESRTSAAAFAIHNGLN